MPATPATLFAPPMSSLVANAGGTIQSLPQVTLVGGRERAFISRLGLAAQASGSVIGVARIPMGAAILTITANTDTSLATATIAFGNAGNNNSAIYGAAATLTATNTPATFAPVATSGVPLTTGVDCVSAVTALGYEDIIMTVGTAALPASGNLVIITRYTID